MPETQMEELMLDQRPPEQQSTIDSERMPFQLTCMPPLDQASVVVGNQDDVKFTVLLESATPSSTSKPEVCLWHNHGGEHEWSELPLAPSSTADHDNIVFIGHSESAHTTRHLFNAQLSGLSKHAHVVSFTLKFRSSPDEDWKWVKDTAGVGDGQLHYQAPADFTKHSSYDIGHFFNGMSSDVKVAKEAPETTDTQLYSLTCPVSSAKGQDSGYQHHQLGQVARCSKWFALVRLWSPWLAPRQGDGAKFELDREGILLSFLRADGLHVVCLAISGVEDVMTTFIHEDSKVVIKGRNERENVGTSRVLVAVAESFDVANCAVMYHARKVVAEHSTAEADLAGDPKQIKTLTDDVKPEWVEEWYDGLSYCTWNGLGQDLTAEKIYGALDELSKNGINITNLIIDDNWQSLSSGDTQFQRGWSRFEANSAGFPGGLKETTSEIRKRYSSVHHIAVWHAILGYWGGIDPNGEIAQNYKTMEVRKDAVLVGQDTFTVVAPSDAKRMYSDFYAFLASAGVDSVKTDAQFALDTIHNAPDRRALITTYQDAWTLAHLRHLSSRAISCMSQFPASLFHTQLPRHNPRLLVRNSDDFFPDVAASHPWHIFCNAHNALLTQHLNALPDWDMFQTSHPWARFHAAARAISGGPIYFTDYPGAHDLPLLHALTAQAPRGSTVILRPSTVGKATNPYHQYAARALLHIAAYHGAAHVGAAFLGLFNVSPQRLAEFVTLASFPGTEEGECLVQSFNTGQLAGPLTRQGVGALHASLAPREADVLTACAVRALPVPESHGGGTTRVASLGLLGKFTGAAGVAGFDAYVEANGRVRVWVSVKALGTVGVWVERLGEEGKTVDGSVMVAMLGDVVVRDAVRLREGRVGGGRVLEVDIERAWRARGKEAGWINEVSVEVFVS